jgi:hypothetical protein
MSKLRIKKAVLVYQAGIANVFEVARIAPTNADRGGIARRLLQSDFRTCGAFVRGLAVAGTLVSTMQCNQAGDIAHADWSEDLDEAPFSDKFSAVVARDGNFVPQHILRA